MINPDEVGNFLINNLERLSDALDVVNRVLVGVSDALNSSTLIDNTQQTSSSE